MIKLVVKSVRRSSATEMHSFNTTALCVLLGLTIMAHLISGEETLAHNCCVTCPRSRCSESFTVRNALPQANSNLHMMCYIWDECGGFSTYSVDIPCKSVEVPTDQGRPPVEQVLCEFRWTKPNDEWFVRAQAMVWSRGGSAPKKTYYMVDSDGFWFSDSPDGTLTKIGSWVGGNYLSAEKVVMGSGIGTVPGFGRDHCRTRSFSP